MNLIDTTFFHGELLIPNLIGTQQANLNLSAGVNSLIQKQEPILLECLFGYEMAKPMISDIDSDQIETSVYKYIIQGDEYTDACGQLAYWEGLKGSALPPVSLVANYVYCIYRRQTVTQTQNFAEVSSLAENASIVSPKEKVITAWNEMIEKIQRLEAYMATKTAEFPTYKPKCQFNFINSLDL